MTSLDVVLVNWNFGDQLRTCLATLDATARRAVDFGRVVVVDNASTDDSADALEPGGLPLLVLRNAANRGFAAACNQGAREGTAEYILFLNPDTRLREDSLDLAIDWLERPENAGVGICGIQLVDESGEIARSCARFPTPAGLVATSLGLDRLMPGMVHGHHMREWDHRTSRRVDHVIGAFFLVRRRVFEALGGFDERYFVYLEDLDFSLRASQAGWSSYYLTEARAFHKGGGSSEQVKAERLRYLLRSRLQFGYRHFGMVAATMVALGTLLFEPLVRVGAALGAGRPGQARDTIRAYWGLWNPAHARRRAVSG
jgi:GT2 family glycosyltransferase